MIKIGDETLEKALYILLNRCLQEQQIPTEWWNAKVILLFKKGQRECGKLSTHQLTIHPL